MASGGLHQELACKLERFSLALPFLADKLLVENQVAELVRQVHSHPVAENSGKHDDDRLLATSVPEYEIRMDMRADGLTDDVWSKGLDSLSVGLMIIFLSERT